MQEELVIIRGGGDLATGVIQKFYRSGIPTLVLETDAPTAIRRSVSLCEAVYSGVYKTEDVTCRRIETAEEWKTVWDNGEVPLLVDPKGESIDQLSPTAVIDAIIAKKNLGTNKNMAPITIALGPGFTAGTSVDVVIETMRGHNLGRLIFSGEALANTGIPGEIGGKSAMRVIHALNTGLVKHVYKIGDVVNEGDTIFWVDETAIKAPFTGLLRGLIREGIKVPKGMKVADIDPRTDVDWHTISDKARCLGGAALEAYLYLKRRA